ncbi:hypothetical protein COCCADRAFT_39267 [Bipolaris zeicola 26-R-13]|uniref:AAA+ ATPase domain-containing protein n=1 Tax=Cochliobolus carbonum (strain 26-R-13) TaxID=930089 RepID=W6YGR4_COCC2|nr:uncharacterized protein COCCADRAFT_39267 [Bipolaris zeicola 26-R-13]EUC30496.1 hypothetical protein COCCADRAFT_39267 [Bipolaris zeicola 26-R-13]
MRLLHFNALGKPVLTDFYGKTIPPYAILSHRWTDSEVLIKDIRDGTYGTKEQGNRKLEFYAHKAAHDDLHKWFTRGWTLQELIAPVSVEFFSVKGHRIGDKASLSQLLHDITSIPLSALHNDPLDKFSISKRRRWVNGRKTKEEEDIVYCLFRILGVSMPTAYGEGKESAVIRLQTELEEASDVPSIIPFAQNPRFVGREEQLAELEAKLFTNEQTTTTAIAIVGPGGTGKSQLALEIAHRMKRNSKNCSVFWINATDTDSLYHSCARVAQKLNITGWDDAQVDMKKLAKRCVEDISTRQCLLIFDNIEKTALLSSELSTTEAANPVADFLPQGKLCSIIFTTKDSDTAQALAPQNLIEMRALTPDTALRMLQIRLARPLSTTEQEVAQCLLRELSYLPLAIIQAIACISASGMTLQEYRLQLDGFKGPALEDSDDSSKGELQESNRRDPIAATLYLSVGQLFHRHELAEQYLCVAACLDRKDISLDILEANLTRKREDAIRILDKYALIIRRPADSALDLHRPVYQALRNLLQREEKLEEDVLRLYVLTEDIGRQKSYKSKW